MNTKRNIFIAFLFNLLFSIFEWVGGLVTGSVAIQSDALHDAGDALAIGISYGLERKSNRPPNHTFTYGYARYSVLASVITTTLLLCSSLFMIYHALHRIVTPTPLHYNGMILFALVGIGVNGCGALVTHQGDSINQKAVNLHLLEDVLGWLAVLVGAIIMKWVDFPLLDPLLSMGVSLFIVIHTLANLKEAVEIFLEKTPSDLCVEELKEKAKELPLVEDIHHLHLWSLDGRIHCATLHLVTDENPSAAKEQLRRLFESYGIQHLTVETEKRGDPCPEKECSPAHSHALGHTHHQRHSVQGKTS